MENITWKNPSTKIAIEEKKRRTIMGIIITAPIIGGCAFVNAGFLGSSFSMAPTSQGFGAALKLSVSL